MSSMSRDTRERFAREHMEKARSMKTDTSEQMEEAMRQVTIAIMFNPLFVTALLFRAHLNTKMNNLNEALVDISIVIQLEEHGIDRRRLAAACGSRASLYRKMNKIKESIIDFSRAVEVEPDNGTWLYELGLSYILQGDKIALAEHFFASALGEKVTGRMTDNVRFRTMSHLGTCKLNLGDFNGAVAVYTKGLELQETAHLHNLLGIAYFLRGEYKTALQSFSRALDMHSFNGEYHVNIGICLFQLGFMQDAFRHFEDAIQKGSNQPLQYFFRGTTALVLNLHQQALTDINEAIALESSREAFHYSKALILAEEGLYDEAVAEFLVVIQLNTDSRNAWMHLGLLQLLQGNLFASLESFTTVLQFGQEDELVHEWIGLVYCSLHYYDLAAESFTRCISFKPTNPVFYFRRGAALIKHGDVHGAYIDLQKAVHELGFSEPKAFHCFSVVLSTMGRYAEALEFSNTAVSCKAGNFRYLLHRAKCHYILGDYEAVVADASCIIDLGHEIAEVYYLRAQSRYALHAFHEAVTDLLQASTLQPELQDNTDYCYAIGVAYLRLRNAQAEAALTKAITLHPKPPFWFFDERAKARQQLGDAKGMLEDLNVVLHSDEGNASALLRRSLAYKALQQYDASARDFEKVRSLDVVGDALACVSYENFFPIDCMAWDKLK